ncbi:MAG TPA: DsrE/DsrF/DrsH-like family protein [Trueperaceae bacterium]|nr:DsrE/DsrF/DrsH-like family protein [Trueperaceae bacterium]
MKDKLNIIVMNGTVDKLLAMATIVSGAVAMGKDVTLFVTFWGLMAFRKGAWQDPAQQKLPAEYQEYAPMMQQAMQTMGVNPWMQTLRTAKELGNVTVYSCSMTQDLFGLKMGDLEDVVDGEKGVAGFIAESQDAEVLVF